EIQIRLTLSIVEIHAAATHELHRRALVRAENRALHRCRCRGYGVLRGPLGRRLHRRCGHAHMLPSRVSTVPRVASAIAAMSEMRTRCTPPSSADSAA